MHWRAENRSFSLPPGQEKSAAGATNSLMQQQQRVAENPPPNRSGFQHNLTNGPAAILVTPIK
jgi:hypothetical protein